MLPLSGVRLRDAWVLVALALLPALLLGALGFRALSSEDAAIQREASLAVEATATRLAAMIERGLDQAVATVPTSFAGDDVAAARTVSAPGFAFAIVLDGAGVLRVPAPAAGGHEEMSAPRCEEERRKLPDAGARAFILASCEHARGPSGRFVWPVLALETPGDTRVEAWARAHRSVLGRDERAAVRADAVRVSQTAVVALLDEVDPRVEGVALALSDPAARRGLREGTIRTDALLARVRRLADGRFVGVAAHPGSIGAWLPTAVPEGLAARLVSTDEGVGVRGLAALGPSLRVLVTPSDPRALALRATRSRRILAVVAAGGAFGAALAALAMFARLRAERRNAALRTDFVSTVSHELRTPLASIRMLAELLEEKRVEEGEREEVHEALAREARRMSELVDRLLGFGRMAAGRAVAHRERVRLDALVEQAIVEQESRDPSMQKVVRALSETWAEVDPSQLRVALDNLLVNARKYGKSPYEVRLRRHGKQTSISVADRGPGIPRRDRRRIFEPFERGDERLARATEGTGLGLSLVAHVAKAHHGRVELESEVGRGSTFTLHIEDR